MTKTWEKKNFTRVAQEYYEDEYKDGVFNDKGEKVIRALNAEEKDWLNKFNDETLANNHGKEGSLHRENLDDYDERKSEFFKETNLRNNDLYGIAKCGNRLKDEMGDESTRFYSESKVMGNLKTEGVTTTVDMLIEDVIEDLNNADDHKRIHDKLLEFSFTMFKLINEEKRRQKKDKDIAKEQAK